MLEEVVHLLPCPTGIGNFVLKLLFPRTHSRTRSSLKQDLLKGDGRTTISLSPVFLDPEAHQKVQGRAQWFRLQPFAAFPNQTDGGEILAQDRGRVLILGTILEFGDPTATLEGEVM